MNKPSAGTEKKRLFRRNNYLAPLPVPTGRKPVDILGAIWRQNEVFLDIGRFNIGAIIMTIWPVFLLCCTIAYAIGDTDFFWLGIAIIGPALCIFIFALYRPVPLPLRFNRQRREVCVPRGDGEYWIVPWETVTATAVEHTSMGQGGKYTTGMLFLGFENPNPDAALNKRHFSIGFGCGGGETAMVQWECMRSFMEIGPDAVFDRTLRFHRPHGILKTYVDDLITAAARKGWFLTLLWEGFFGLFIFNTLLIDVLERWKLHPPPEPLYPEIIEWSKPLPPEQWATRSPALEAAIAQREQELSTC